MARGARAYGAGQWADAAKLARDALRVTRDNPAALRLLARSSARLGRADAAIAIYTRRLDGKEIDAEDYLLLGYAYERQRQSDLAATAWNNVLEAGQPAPRILEELARIHLKARRFEDAIPLTERLSRQAGWEARGSMMLGTARAALNNVPGAAASFRQALSFNPAEVDNAQHPGELRKLIARTYLRMSLAALARTQLLSILNGRDDSEVAWLLSRAFLQERDNERAVAALGRAGSYRALHPLDAEPAPFVGEERCERCHKDIYRSSLDSRHTRSHHRGAQLEKLPLPDRPLPDPDDPEVTHDFRLQDGKIRAEARVGQQVFTAVIDYAFGTADRYLTMVSRDSNGKFRIARLSHFVTPQGGGWDRSALDRTHPTREYPAEFQGDPIGVRDGLARCLYCHVTNPRTGSESIGPETGDRGIGCERCHGPGGHHLLAVQAGFPDLAIINPAVASPEAVTRKQCNDCHVLAEDFRKHDLENPGWVRSQGVGWSMSRCNTQSEGSFGCVTCHDPHKAAHATSTPQYEAKCLHCHASASRDAQKRESGRIARASKGRPAPACPVDSTNGCISCHMPRVRIDAVHLDLTDHYIRVARSGVAPEN
jgi:Flp pilus assembly protein TadD